MDKTPGELYKERLKRIEDAIQLKVPDRVPVVIEPGLFPAKYAGMTCEEAFYDYDKWAAANKKMALDYQPDMVQWSSFQVPGPVLEALDCKQLKWPGHGVPPDASHQFVEGEYMKAEEYDVFMQDMADFGIRTYLPRIFGALEPLKMLPDLGMMCFGYASAGATAVLATPEFARALASLVRAGQEMLKWRGVVTSFQKEVEAMGFPSIVPAGANAPFDRISDYLRGMRGSMLDMYRQPDKLLEACEKVLPLMIKVALSAARASGNTRLFITLHRGADGFMSRQQFETFYWPGFKKLLVSLVEANLTPCVFFEGDCTSRLEYFLELPGAKIMGHFDATDIFKAKEVLRHHMCIRGNVPSSILQTGSVQDVEDYCKRLIDVVGKGGGFILSPRSDIAEAKPENLKAMVDFTKEYGVYK